MDPRVNEAFAAVPRARFLPPDQRECAGNDRALAIGHGVTNSQPTTVRNMLELLGPRPGDRVLDVGSGSGWTTALLARMVGPTGSVVAVERIPELVTESRALLADTTAGDGTDGTIEVHPAAPDRLGHPAGAPYDRILVSADAAALPGALVEQLAVGGVLVVPVAGEMLRVTRTAGEPDVERHGHYRFVRLVEE